MAMNVQVIDASLEKVVLFAPLFENQNHKGTVFGGSLHSVCTLACWSLVWIHTQEVPCEIVNVNSFIQYKAPVTKDFTAHCSLNDAASWNMFKNTLLLRKKARIELSSSIGHDGQTQVLFQGTFAALRKNEKQ